VEEARLKIIEPPRFFEGFLRGRSFREAPDVTSRICGICPVAYQMSACQAVEAACGVTVPEEIRLLRRLLYCGEWIESHALHVFMLHLPDFLGFPDAVQMAQQHGDLVKDGLRLKKLGNAIMEALGGRAIHPINVKVGGFFKLPDLGTLAALRGELDWAARFCEAALERFARLDFPAFERDYELVALRHPDEYPMNEGRLVSNKGMDVPIEAYDDVLVESHVPHSTALHTRVVGRGPAHMGPLARFALNFDRLTARAQQAAARAGLGQRCDNPFKSLLVRMVETLYACEEAARIIDAYRPPAEASVPVVPRAGRGHGATEAPRGICYQRYQIDGEGTITDCKIVAPTSVNQASIEQDLWHFAEARLGLDDPALTLACEHAIRNYDPCISCSAHFLRLTVERV
jgi:sulfhydrogenase subunit alpha